MLASSDSVMGLLHVADGELGRTTREIALFRLLELEWREDRTRPLWLGLVSRSTMQITSNFMSSASRLQE